MLESFTTKQKKIIITIGIVVFIGVVYFIYNKFGNISYVDESEEILVNSNHESLEENKSTKGEDMIVVHIAGAVKSPGVVKLEDGSRLEDAIEMAGGLTEEADISNVNLAYVLDDGVKIIIPEKGKQEAESSLSDSSIGKNIILDGNSSENLSTAKKESLININKATEAELEMLSRYRAITFD